MSPTDDVKFSVIADAAIKVLYSPTMVSWLKVGHLSRITLTTSLSTIDQRWWRC
jgi:hypothetical protein